MRSNRTANMDDHKSLVISATPDNDSKELETVRRRPFVDPIIFPSSRSMARELIENPYLPLSGKDYFIKRYLQKGCSRLIKQMKANNSIELKFPGVFNQYSQNKKSSRRNNQLAHKNLSIDHTTNRSNIALIQSNID